MIKNQNKSLVCVALNRLTFLDTNKVVEEGERIELDIDKAKQLKDAGLVAYVPTPATAGKDDYDPSS